MPPKKKTEPPQAPAGPRTRNAPIDITNWRQQSQIRAHERNRITYIAVDLAGFMRARRVDKGTSQPDVAYNLELPDGTPPTRGSHGTWRPSRADLPVSA